MKSPTLILCLVNLAVVIGFAVLHPDNVNAIGFGIASVLWSVGVLLQELAANFRIRLLEHQKRQLELQLGMRNSLSNQSQP